MGAFRNIVLGLTVLSVDAVGAAQTSSFGPGAGGTKSKYTYPQPPKIKPAIDVPAAGAFIPTHPEKYRWTVTNEIGGVPTTTGKVTVYSIVAGKLAPTGMLDPGVEVKLDFVRASGKLLYYGIPWTKAGRVDTLNGGTAQNPRYLAWVPGNYIKGVPLNPQ